MAMMPRRSSAELVVISSIDELTEGLKGFEEDPRRLSRSACSGPLAPGESLRRFPTIYDMSRRCVHGCESCNRISSYARSDNTWFYDWLWELNQRDKSRDLVDKQSQVKMKMDHKDDEVNEIRNELRNLQKTQPAWAFLDSLKTEVMQRAMHTTECYELEVLNNQVFPLNADDIKESMKSTSANGKDSDDVFEKLVDFVGFHVYRLLITLYSRIRDEEKILNDLKDVNGTMSDNRRDGKGDRSLALFRRWYQSIHGEGRKKRIKLFGPVGDRPLHVCATAISRFDGLDFYGKGNYMTHGISRGMKGFILDILKNPEPVVGVDEIFIQYGKDYCSAFGHAIMKSLPDVKDGLGKRGFVDRFLSSSTYNVTSSNVPWLIGDLPPYSDELLSWIKLHREIARSKKDQDFQTMLYTTGIYEGETIMISLIACNNSTFVHWLLELEKDLEGIDDQSIGMIRALSRSFIKLSVKGLFYLPMNKDSLTSFSFLKSWRRYLNTRLRDKNTEASSRTSYFGKDLLSFSASQGNPQIFGLILRRTEHLLLKALRGYGSRAGSSQSFTQRESFVKMRKISVGSLRKYEILQGPSLETSTVENTAEEEIWRAHEGNDFGDPLHRLVRQAVLDFRDPYGNTMLHIVALNMKLEMFDYLMDLGANPNILDMHGLTPFTLTARFGVWKSFHHIWNKHKSTVMWNFGNVQKLVENHSAFDWRGYYSFTSRSEISSSLYVLVRKFMTSSYIDQIKRSMLLDQGDVKLEQKLRIVESRAQEMYRKDFLRDLSGEIGGLLGVNKFEVISRKSQKFLKDSEDLGFLEEFYKHKRDLRSAIRLITLFKPKGWYEAACSKLEPIIMQKWVRGYRLVFVSQTLLPYCLLLILFGIMWSLRRLSVSEHSFWWAERGVVESLDQSLQQWYVNPVKMNSSELTALVEMGQVPKEYIGPESRCGPQSLLESYSGRLQIVLASFGVASLFRWAWVQRRIRPSDLDEDEDLRIEIREMINFTYFNLESLIHLIVSGLLLAIVTARVMAGTECKSVYVHGEKNVTAIAALLLFFNLLIILKAYKGMGLLVLGIYKFLMTDVWHFLIMYSIFFVSFLVALQTFTNANYAYMSWMEFSETIVPQVMNVTNGFAYAGNDPNIWSLNQTSMSIDGCRAKRKTLTGTAFSLLEISFGDGLADAIDDARQSKYTCAGLNSDGLYVYILVLWVFLTNVLVLNMLIAMMNCTLDDQKKVSHATWLLDISYRIMRYEEIFPELIARMQSPQPQYSIWRWKYFVRLFWDVCFILYCLPELHLWGLTHAAYISSITFLAKAKGYIEGKDDWDSHVARIASMICPQNQSSCPACSVSSSRLLRLSRKVSALAQLPSIKEEVEAWHEMIPASSADTDLRSILLMVSLIAQLDSIERSFDESFHVDVILLDSAQETDGAQPLENAVT